MPPFTTGHGAIAEIVERYRKQHQEIETDLFEYFSGLRAAYGSTRIPASIQGRIDEIVAASAALRPRELVPGQIKTRRGYRETSGV